MSKILATLLACTSALSSVSALPSQYAELDSRAVSGNFTLFAFGSDSDTEIGGFPIFYFDGLAYIANPAKVNYTTDYVLFEANASASTQWVASPLAVTTSNSAWANSDFYVPVGGGPIGFYKEGVSNITTNIITTGFHFYGTTAMLQIDGTLETLWYAVNTSTDGLWSVGWNATANGIDDAELLSLRAVTAPNVDYPGPQ